MNSVNSVNNLLASINFGTSQNVQFCFLGYGDNPIYTRHALRNSPAAVLAHLPLPSPPRPPLP